VISDARVVLACVGLHPERSAALVERFGSADAVVAALGAGRISAPPQLREAASVTAGEWRRRLSAARCTILGSDDSGYPSWLSALPGAPDAIFVKGSVPELPGVAVVGTRTPTAYGLRMAEHFGAALSVAGWPVVSGLARGVDAAAHRGGLYGPTPGAAVLGSGIDLWYPAGNRRLGEDLLDAGGAIVSEYPPGIRPEPWRFPLRNRIISGLAVAVVVVEARSDGGALITARYGLEQGREVLALPGDIDRETSVGCNLLIRDGALPVLGADDLVEALSLLTSAPPPAGGDTDTDPVVRLAGPVGRPLDWMATELGWPISDLLTRVTQLELEGRVRRHADLVVATCVKAEASQGGDQGAP
jgi:DNA processing protein